MAQSYRKYCGGVVIGVIDVKALAYDAKYDKERNDEIQSADATQRTMA